jgi:23S rRNA pseudouridine955/2504/2580 synthase
MTDHKVTEADTGIRLDRWFKRHMPHVSHGLLEKSLRKGDVRVGGKKAKASDRVEAGQIIMVKEEGMGVREGIDDVPRAPRTVLPSLSPDDIILMQQAVLFKSNEAIVINKPPGLAVQGGSGITRSVDGMLGALRFESNERPKLVHRLDKDTSGVLVLARSTAAATRLAKAFATKVAEKTYWALVKGAPEIHEGKIDLPLSKQEEGDHEKVGIDEEDGKRAVTHYRIIERLSRTLAWVELMPITGRTHQLRVHMAAIGHPIIGDGKYGARDAFMDGISNKLHLHAQRIVIPGVLDVSAPMPKHMKESWKTLGLEEKEE